MKKLVKIVFSSIVLALSLVSYRVLAETGRTGDWMESFAAATNYAYSTKTPLVLVWSKDECDHCETLDAMLDTAECQQWVSSSDYVFCHVKGSADWKDVGVNKGTRAKEYTMTAAGLCKKLSGTPFVSLLWNVTGEMQATNFMGRTGSMLVRGGGRSLFEQFSESVDTFFENCDVDPAVKFACGNTIGDRLEATVGYTTFVDVPLKRDVARSSGPMTNRLTWTFGGDSATEDVIWSAGEETRYVRISTDLVGAKANDRIILKIAGRTTLDTQESAITFVERENSPKNPHWIGTRTADELAWGEWTMDLAIATNKVAAFNATNTVTRAYTLALVAGGLWCPDCARNDAYVIDTPEFKQWARDNRVACVCIDIPSDPTVGGPCLLNRQVKEVSKKYSDADPEHGTYQSGTGYLSRWMIDDLAATAVMDRNRSLVGINTLNGGWNRPERANQKRTGVPIFVLLRDDGTIAGRIETFASTSPDDASYIKGNIRRLTELLETVSDSDEEANFHPLTTTVAINAPLGGAQASLSGADQADTFLLTNTVDYARLTVTANGVTSGGVANTLSIWCMTGGVARVVASQTGLLSDGALVVTADLDIPDAKYFVRVEMAGLGDLSTFGQDIPLVSEIAVSSALSYVTGTVSFDETAQTVYVPDGAGSVSVTRDGGSFGTASATVFIADAGSAAGCYDFRETNLVWAAGESGTQTIDFAVFRMEGIAEGDFTLGLRAGAGNVAEISAGQHVVTLQDTTDPTFEDLEIEVGAYSKFGAVEVLALRNIDVEKAVRLKKTAGSLPSGVKLAYDKRLGAVVLSGTPSKPGVYVAEYVVSQGGVTGLPATITIVVADPQDENPYVNAKRSSQAIPLLVGSGTNTVVAGTLTVAVTSNNKISAKYSGTESKTVSFSGSWQTITETGSAYAILERNGNLLTLEMDANGSISAEAQLLPGCSAFAEDDEDWVMLNGWSPYPDDDYEDWSGYYTVTIVDAGGAAAGSVVPSGTGYLTLTVKDSGKVTWKGVLPEGSAISGSSVLDRKYVDIEGDYVAELPIFKRSAKNVFGSKLAIKANSERWYDDTYAQMIHNAPDIMSYVLHRENSASWLSYRLAYGGWYEKGISPALLCETFGYDEDEIKLTISTERLAVSEKYGEPQEIGESYFAATDRKLEVVDAAYGVKLSLTKSTGIFTGSAIMSFDSGKTVKGTIKGVLLPGWSGCGECVEGRTLVDRPFGSGTFYYKDIVNGKSVVRSCPSDLVVTTASNQ